MSDNRGAGAPWERDDCLVAQAARKRTPRHQFMDQGTLAWIESHRREMPIAADMSSYRAPHALSQIFDAMPIPASWYAEPMGAEGIHGIRHLLRTAVLAAVLAHQKQLSDEETEALLVAAVVHDCRRIHDKDDLGHGLRGAAWLSDRAEEVFELFGIRYTLGRSIKASMAVRLHELPYADFTDDDMADHSLAPRVADLLKTADALDRYRLPKRKWWLNEDYLRVVPSAGLSRLAFELVVASETHYLAGVDSASAVWEAASKAGLA